MISPELPETASFNPDRQMVCTPIAYCWSQYARGAGGSESSGQQHSLQHHGVVIFAFGRRHLLYSSVHWWLFSGYRMDACGTTETSVPCSSSAHVIMELLEPCSQFIDCSDTIGMPGRGHRNDQRDACGTTETSVPRSSSGHVLTDLLESYSQSAECSDTNDSAIKLKVPWPSRLVAELSGMSNSGLWSTTSNSIIGVKGYI